MKKFILHALIGVAIASCSTATRSRSEGNKLISSDLTIYVDSTAPVISDTVFQIMSYNVENLFDTVYAGTEYRDYSPGTSNYSSRFFWIKVHNVERVIKDAGADIVGLQEVESIISVHAIQESLREEGFRYYVVADRPQKTAVNVALISKYPIVFARGYYTIPRVRNVLLAGILINGDTLFILVNHWKSKSGPESMRIEIAKVVRAIVDSILASNPHADIVLVGDFNTHHDETQSDVVAGDAFNPRVVVGLIDILKTTGDRNLLKKGYLYNLWYELPEDERGSHYFAGRWGTLDHIIVSAGLMDSTGISYVPGSFRVFKPPYLLTPSGKPYRWQTNRGPGFTEHLGKGFSDHLPIMATFVAR